MDAVVSQPTFHSQSWFAFVWLTYPHLMHSAFTLPVGYEVGKAAMCKSQVWFLSCVTDSILFCNILQK